MCMAGIIYVVHNKTEPSHRKVDHEEFFGGINHKFLLFYIKSMVNTSQFCQNTFVYVNKLLSS